jgi:hypothetical protein
MSLYIKPLVNLEKFVHKFWFPVGILKIPKYKKGVYIIDCYFYKFYSISLIDRLALSVYFKKDVILEEEETVKAKKLSDLSVCDFNEFKEYIKNICSITPSPQEKSSWKNLDLMKWSVIRIFPSKKIIEDIEKNVSEITQESLKYKLNYKMLVEELFLDKILENNCEWKPAYSFLCIDKKEKVYYIINNKKYKKDLLKDIIKKFI